MHTSFCILLPNTTIDMFVEEWINVTHASQTSKRFFVKLYEFLKKTTIVNIFLN